MLRHKHFLTCLFAGNLAVVILPARMASGNIIAFNGANIIQTAQGVPSGAAQASGAIPNPQYFAQPLGMSTSAPQQVPQKGRLEKFLNAEIKVLGVSMFTMYLFEVH